MKGATAWTVQAERAALAISIHAPVKGATAPKHFNFHKFSISIHAPVKGATNNMRASLDTIGHFNPRTREGCDMNQNYEYQDSNNHFNPRTREGCDLH